MFPQFFIVDTCVQVVKRCRVRWLEKTAAAASPACYEWQSHVFTEAMLQTFVKLPNEVRTACLESTCTQLSNSPTDHDRSIIQVMWLKVRLNPDV